MHLTGAVKQMCDEWGRRAFIIRGTR